MAWHGGSPRRGCGTQSDPANGVKQELQGAELGRSGLSWMPSGTAPWPCVPLCPQHGLCHWEPSEMGLAACGGDAAG